MPELDPRWHLRSEANTGKTRCGLNLGAFTTNDVDVWLEHVHAGSCTECMLKLDRSQKQYTRAGDAIKEAVAPPAPPPAPPPPAPEASNEPSTAADVIVPPPPDPDHFEDEGTVAKPAPQPSKKKR